MKHLSHRSMILSSLLLTLTATAAPQPGEVLGLDAYLSQVSAAHQGLQAARESSQGSALRSAEGGLVFSPGFFADVSGGSDARPANSFFQPTEVDFWNVRAGFSQLTPFGMQAKLGYGITYNYLVGAAPGTQRFNNYYDTGPTLEVIQPLWGNGFGTTARATSSLIEASALANKYSESFRAKQILLEAELGYWRMALARQVLLIEQGTLKRARELKDWNERRVKLNLGDRSDLLQAEAAVKLRELGVESATDELKSSARAFNSYRKLDSDAVPENLVRIDSAQFSPTIVRAEFRDDVQAAREGQRIADANAVISKEKNTPTIDIRAQLALGGKDGSLPESISQSFNMNQRMYAVGVSFTTPLDFISQADVREGYAKERTAAELNYGRKLFEQDQQWRDLTSQLQDAKKRLVLAGSLTKIQEEKLQNERERNRKGRSTTYQVILFEQDYSSALLNEIRIEADVLRILAQLKTFRGDS